MSAQLSQLTDWFSTNIAGTAAWSVIGLVAVGLLAVYVLYLTAKSLMAVISALSIRLASRKRQSTQGFGIAIAPIIGPKGAEQTKAVIRALEDHLHLFTFGSPFEIVRAPRMRSKGAKGLRAAATSWLEKSSTDLVVWGLRPKGKNQPSEVEVLSLGGSLPPSDAMHSEGLLPFIAKDNPETSAKVVAYLIARAMQPGLADGTAFKAEKLAPVADILRESLGSVDKVSMPQSY